MLYKLLCSCCLITISLAATSVTAKIVFQSKRDGKGEIYVMNDDGSRVRRLTHNSVHDSNPRWAPDGKQITFTRAIAGEPRENPRGEPIDTRTYDVFLMNADGSQQRNLTNHPTLNTPDSWSPDGRHIVFTSSRSGALNIHILTLEDGAIKQLTRNEGAMSADWAPNGRHFVYEQSAGSFWSNIHIMSANGRNQKPLLPPAQGLVIRSYPRWAPDSIRILYAEAEYEQKVVRDEEGKTIFLNVISSKLIIQNVNLDAQQIIKLPKAWRPGVACWMSNGEEILFAADETGIITKERGNYDLYRYHLPSGKITKLTDHPAADYWPHWVPGALSVSPMGKLTVLWGELKQME